MHFVLHYRGPLKANGKPEHKHAIRVHFHEQLKRLWEQAPLNEHGSVFTPKTSEGDWCLLRPIGPFVFVPLVAAELHAVAQLKVTLLRPEAPGALITQGGDIDNRLKTLFDALSVPPHDNQLPAGVQPSGNQVPYFFCLLEDDNLVTSVSVKTVQLLEPVQDRSLVDAQIEVITRVTRITMGNPNWA